MPPKKLYRKKRTIRKRRFNITKKKVTPRLGYFKMLRWNVNDSTNNCYVLLQGNDTVPSGTGAATFTLSQVANFGETVALFDNYRMTRVVYRWVVSRNPDWFTTTANRGWSVRVNWCHDFNDSSPISTTLMYQRANMRELYLNNDRLTSRWYSIKPAILSQMYEGLSATAYSPKWKQWMDTADNAAPHYGIKYSYDNLYAGVNLRLEAKCYFEFKGIS